MIYFVANGSGLNVRYENKIYSLQDYNNAGLILDIIKYFENSF